MSIALKTTDALPDQHPYRLSTRELTLRYYFIAAFTGVDKSEWALRLAAWRVADELRELGSSPEAVAERVRYIAAIPLSFHFRRGYKDAHERLSAVVERAISMCFSRILRQSPADLNALPR
jgi:hypothetical protein